jgi:cryptochrome
LIREAPQTLFPKLFKAWKVTHLVFEKDTDAYARDRDAEVMKLAREAGVEVIVRSGRTLWDSDELVKKNHGKPTMSISQVQTAGPKVGKICRPLPAPKFIPDPGDTTLDFQQEQPDPKPDFNDTPRKDGDKDKSYENISGPNGDFGVPTLDELGFPAATTPHRGGESTALLMLKKLIADEHYTATFEKPNTAPTAFAPQSTTLLSPHLHFGSLSIRSLYHAIQDIISSYKGKTSQPPVSLTGQLLFRDMYFGAQAVLGYSFGQTEYNSHCRFIPWKLPTAISPTTHLPTGAYTIDSSEAEAWFQRWKSGLTGFPWIDALMRQLRQEGWIHHLGRHAVACFLTRGGCYISWERGAEVFEELLLDHETACNAGNWQWLSCTAFFSQFYRCYSPVAFPQRWDKQGEFVRRYVPELKELDQKYIYEPWKAPIADLRKAGVKIEGNGETNRAGEGIYPKPMFDFNERRVFCLDAMKKAYSIGLYGNDEKVLNGTWKQLFDDRRDEKQAKKSEGSGDGGIEGDEKGTKRKGENKGDSDSMHKRKPRGGQGTLDAHVKKTKK